MFKNRDRDPPPIIFKNDCTYLRKYCCPWATRQCVQLDQADVSPPVPPITADVDHGNGAGAQGIRW